MSHCYSTGLNEALSLFHRIPCREGRRILTLVMTIAVCMGWTSTAGAAAGAYHGGAVPIGSGFSHPYGVAVDAHGNVFVADTANHRVCELLAVNGQVTSLTAPTTLASGFSFSAPVGVAVDTHGNVFAADGAGGAVYEIVADVNGQVSSSSSVVLVGGPFSFPTGVAVDASGNLYVVDRDAHAIYKFTPTGGVYPTTGTGTTVSTAFTAPMNVAVDALGSLFITDHTLGRIFAIEPAATLPVATPAQLVTSPVITNPFGIAVDTNGDLFVSDDTAGTIYRVASTNGGFSGTSTATVFLSPLTTPEGLAVDAGGNLFYTEETAGTVSEDALGVTSFGPVNVGASSATVKIPFTFTAGGYVTWTVLTQGATAKDFIEDVATTDCSTTTNYSIGNTCSVAVKFSPKYPGQRLGSVQLMSGGSVIATALLSGVGSGPQIIFPSNNTPSATGSGFKSPQGVAVDASGNLFVSDLHSSHLGVYEILASGGSVNAVGSGFTSPRGVAVDASGNVFVADDNNVFEIVAVNGQVTAASVVNAVGSGFVHPNGIAVDAYGNVFVADSDSGHHGVYEIVAVYGQVSSTSWVKPIGGSFASPYGVAVDTNGNVFVTDSGNVYQIVAVNGQVMASSTTSLIQSISTATGLAIDAAGDLYVTSYGGGRVYEIAAVNGLVSATSAVNQLRGGFGNPIGVAVEAKGNLFVADPNGSSGTVYKLALATAPAKNFDDTKVNTASGLFTPIVANNGNANLTFSVPGSGKNPSVPLGFSWDASSTCPQAVFGGSAVTLASGANCTIGIVFEPTTVATYSGNLTLTDDTLNVALSTQTIALSGDSVKETATVSTSAAAVNFGETAKTLTASVAFLGSVAPTGAVTIQVGNGTTVAATCSGSTTPLTCTASYPTSTLPISTPEINAFLATDAFFTAATNSATPAHQGTLTISAMPTATVVTGSGAPAIGQKVTYTATVTPSPADSGAYTNSMSTSSKVTFTDTTASTVLCTDVAVTVNSTNATATCDASFTSVGTHNVKAAFVSGDANYSASDNAGSLFAAGVVQSATTTVVSPTTTNAVVNDAVVFTATVSPSVSPLGTSIASFAGGTVTFTDATTSSTLCAVTITAGMMGTTSAAVPCSTTALDIVHSPHSIHATYSGDAKYITSTSADVQATMAKAVTSTTTTATPSTAVLNQTVTLTAKVTTAGNTQTMGGVVVFKDNSAVIGGGACNGGTGVTVVWDAPTKTGTASCTTQQLSAGAHAISADYGGDTNYLSSSSIVAPVNVTAATGAVTLTALPASPTTINTPVTFTATVPFTPPTVLTGTMSITDNGSVMACSSSTWSAATGIGTCTTSGLTLGNHAIVVKYNGDANYQPTDGSIAAYAVNQGTTSLTVATSGSPSIFQHLVTFTATISHTAGPIGLTGTVNFTDSVTGLSIPNCSAQAVNASTGVATCAMTELAVGPHTITGTYSGDSNFAGSNNTRAQVVNPTQATLALSLPPSAKVNEVATLIASFSVASGTTPAKSIVFTDSNNPSVPLCSLIPTLLSSASGTDTFQATCLTNVMVPVYVGSVVQLHTITATYAPAPDTDVNLSVVPKSGTMTINPADTQVTIAVPTVIPASQITITNASTAVTLHSGIQFTATVTPAPGAPTVNPGTVTFTSGGATLCTAVASDPSSGVATCTASNLPKRDNNTVTAVFTPTSSNFVVSSPVTSTAFSVPDFEIGSQSNFAVTRTYTTKNDPLQSTFSSPNLNLSVTSINQFSGTEAVSCTGKLRGSTGTTGKEPVCFLNTTSSTTSLSISTTNTSYSVPFYIDASVADAGVYTFTVNVTDSATSIARTSTFEVTVVPNALYSASTLISGSTTGNSVTGAMDFYVPNTVSTLTFDSSSCVSVFGTGISTPEALSKAGLTCSFGTVKSPVGISGTTLQVINAAITVTAGSYTSASVAVPASPASDRKAGLMLAGGLLIPFLGLLGFSRRRKAVAALFRAVLVIALGIAALHTMGCGGSFSPNTAGTSVTTTPPGIYYLLVKGTGSDTKTYYSVVEVHVGM